MHNHICNGDWRVRTCGRGDAEPDQTIRNIERASKPDQAERGGSTAFALKGAYILRRDATVSSISHAAPTGARDYGVWTFAEVGQVEEGGSLGGRNWWTRNRPNLDTRDVAQLRDSPDSRALGRIVPGANVLQARHVRRFDVRGAGPTSLRSSDGTTMRTA